MVVVCSYILSTLAVYLFGYSLGFVDLCLFALVSFGYVLFVVIVWFCYNWFVYVMFVCLYFCMFVIG